MILDFGHVPVCQKSPLFWEQTVRKIDRTLLAFFKLQSKLVARYLAVAETTTENKATVTVYDLLHEGAKKRKVLQGVELTSGEFNSVAFSPDSKYLAAQSGSPDWTLYLWVWEKNKLLTTARTCNPVGANAASVTQISFSPQVKLILSRQSEALLTFF